MKKLISLLLISLILCFSLGAVSVFAYEEDKWVLAEDARYLSNNGYTFYPIYPSENFNGYEQTSYRDLEFADEETAQKFEGSYVDAYNYTTNYCVWVHLCYDTEYYLPSNVVLYVREDYIDVYEKMLTGEAEQYVVKNDYKSLYFRFTKEQMEDWLSSEKVNMPATDIYEYLHSPMFANDSAKGTKVECGTVLWDMSTDDFYLLYGADYDRNKVYTVGDTLTVYKLEDEDVRERLALYISYVPEDDLEWMNPGISAESDNTVLYILAGIFFGFIPFAVLVFSTVMFFATKTKSYRRGFVLMGVGSILILLASTLMLLFLL